MRGACKRGSSRRHAQLASALVVWVKRGGEPEELLRAANRVVEDHTFDLDSVKVMVKRDMKKRGHINEVERSSLDLYIASLAEAQKNRCGG